MASTARTRGAMGTVGRTVLLGLAACAPPPSPCGRVEAAPYEVEAVRELFVGPDTLDARFRARHGIPRQEATWVPRHLDDPAECAPVAAALEAWVDTVSAGTPEGGRQRAEGYEFRIYEAPGFYVVTLDLLDGGEPVEGYGSMQFFRAEDLVMVASLLF